MARRDLQGKLATVDLWVRDEFAFVDDLMQSLGGTTRVESGPGVAYRVEGAAIVRAHPKRRYLCLGFPDALRADVDALTHALRPQRGAAWLNYGPGLCDRDTIETLVESSMRVRQTGAATQRLPTVQSVRAEQADLALLLTILRAFKRHEKSTSARSGVKVLREAIYLHWEVRHLPDRNRYSPRLPHSPAAVKWRSAGNRGGLVFEHVRPVSIVIRQLLAEIPADEAALRTALEQLNQHVIITKEEDNRLTSAGYRNAMPNANNPWSRYRVLGLRRSDFKSWSGPS